MELDWYQKLVFQSAALAQQSARSIQTHCLCPGCMQPPIHSHSQQAKGALAAIARDGKVVMPSRDILRSLRQGLKHGRPEVSLCLETVHKASTFMGFCAKHDTELFRCIERRPLIVGNDEQVLSFHRRAMAFELRNKFDMLAFLMGQFCSPAMLNTVPEDVATELSAHRLLLRGDFDFIWAPLWEKHAMCNVNYVWRIIPRKIGISLASAISAMTEKHLFTYSNRHVDLQANTIDRPRPSFTLTIAPQDAETHVIMAWNHCIEPFIGPFQERMSSKDDRVFSKFLNQCVFCHSEDYCLSPELWDSLSPEMKSVVEKDLLAEFCHTQMVVPDIISV